MEVSKLRSDLAEIYKNTTNHSGRDEAMRDIKALDNMMMGVYGEMWDESVQEYT